MNERVLYNKRAQMKTIFESWEFLLYEKVDALDHLVSRIYYEADSFKIPAAIQNEFMREKFIDMIEQIAERRR